MSILRVILGQKNWSKKPFLLLLECQQFGSAELSKLRQLKAYNSLYNYDFICIPETYLDSITHDKENIQVDGYILIRSDHPSDSKKDGVCFSYKESLGVKIINLLAHNECILCEVSIENCNGFIAAMYRSPSQNNAQFGKFFIFLWWFNKWIYTFKTLVLSNSGRF